MQGRKRSYDVLKSRSVVAADDFIDGEEQHRVPLVVRAAYEELKKELRKANRTLKERKEAPAAKHKASVKESNGQHPAVTGLSVGGAKELIDWILAVATEGDKYGQEFLQLSFIDGGITAIIAGCAAWLAKGSKK